MPAKKRTTTRKRSNPAAVASASAKVEAIAKVSFEHKKLVNVTEIIPPDVTRAKSNAWLDLISPLTEWAGLKGDELRFKRTQLRLQREDVLSQIVERAREKIADLSRIEKPIPNKFLVPFLEKASLEDFDSSLIDMWASLLASAAEGFSSHHIHFVSIISQLSAKQGIIFKSLIGTESARECDLAMNNVNVFYDSARIRRTIQKSISERLGAVEFSQAVSSLFKDQRNGVVVAHGYFEDRATYNEIKFYYTSYKNEDELDYSILNAVGLIKEVNVDYFHVGRWWLTIVYYHLTQLGFHFAQACGIVRGA